MPPNPNNPVKGEREVRKTEEDAEECRGTEKKKSVCSLVDELLSDIYGKAELKRKQSLTTTGEWSWHESDQRNRGNPRFRSNLKQIEVKCWSKDIEMLREEITALESLIAEESNNLVKYLKRKDYLLARREGHYDVITAVIHAISTKTRDDMKMKFSLTPGTETGFSQWLDAMKMVAQLPGGVPSEFRTKLWLQLSERHLSEQNIDWDKAEAIIFNEWTNPDDEELGVQIVKDLHRTGCSLFCGAQEQNQALLKRVLLAYARWNKNVGYCQGFNMLAALILQVMDRDEKNAVKVMIYLIEGVLPESYFANNLRGLSVDMAVFRDLLRLRLPKLSKHLEALQNDTNSGTSYEPPLTNVFTMQWFLTLFSNCLPQQTVLRVWDLVFLHGNEVLLRTALAIWGILQERIMSVESADEFYSIMGVVTREMLEFGLMDANNLIKMIVMVDPFPNELQELREKYLYNISPWTQSVQSAARKGIKLFYSDPEDQDDTEDEDKIALATAYGVFRRRVSESGSREVQPMGPTLDISVLKQQYAKLRQRQRQAHIIISAACSSSIPANLSSVPTVSVNHLLMGKSALVNKGRRIGPPEGSIPPPKNRAVKGADVRKQSLKNEVVISGETLDWKDAEKRKCSTIESKENSNTDGRVANNKLKTKSVMSCNGLNREGGHFGEEEDVEDGRKRRGSTSSASSTSTELCDDEFHRLSDFDSEETNPDRGRQETPIPYHPERETAETHPTYEEVRECAAKVLKDIEEAVEASERLRHLKNPDNNNRKGEGDSESLPTSSHDNIIIKSPGIGDVEEEFLKTEPEVPIDGKELDNTENRIFDRSKMEETTLRKESGSKIRQERDRRKSDLALSVIKENLEMLSKFSQKSAVKEERNESGDEKINGYKEVEKSIAKKMKRVEEREDKAGMKDENKTGVVQTKEDNGVMVKERPECRVLEGMMGLVKMPEEEREVKEVVLGVKNKLEGGDRPKSAIMDVKLEEDRLKRLMEAQEIMQEEDRSRRQITGVKQEDQPKRTIEGQEKMYEDSQTRREITEVKREENRVKRALENQEKVYSLVRSGRELTEVIQEEDRPKRAVEAREMVHEEDLLKGVATQLKQEEDRPRRIMVVEEKVCEVERSSSQMTELKQENQLKRMMDTQEKVHEADRSRKERIEVKQEDRPKTAIGIQDKACEDDRTRSEGIELKQEEDRLRRVMEAQAKVQESSSQIDELKREEGRAKTVMEVQEKMHETDRSRRGVTEVKQEDDRPRRLMDIEEENRSKRMMEVQEKIYEGGRSRRELTEVKQEEDKPKRVMEVAVPEKDRSRTVITELKPEEDRPKEVQEKACEGGRSRRELTEAKREKEEVINGKPNSYVDHFKGEKEQGAMTHQKTSRVNKEVNTDITIAADIASSPSSTLKTDESGNVDDFLVTLISTKSIHKSPERFKPDKPCYRESKDSSNVRPFGREDLAERWKKESERIESKIEMSKSDWDLKMKRIAELETTTREKLNEMKSKSIVHRHRSLDRFEGRDRKSPLPRIHIPLDESEDLESRKMKISALSFDEITSRTEKLLGANLSLEASSHRKFRKSFDENGDTGKTYEYYSSPTSPEYRPRKRAEYSSPKRYEARWKHSQPAEEDWLTITEENGRGATLELVSPGRKPEKEQSPLAGFNPFPTRTLSRPKELGVRLGMYPPSPEGAHSSKKSQ